MRLCLIELKKVNSNSDIQAFDSLMNLANHSIMR